MDFYLSSNINDFCSIIIVSNHKHETCIANELQKFGIRNSSGCLGGDGGMAIPGNVAPVC